MDDGFLLASPTVSSHHLLEVSLWSKLALPDPQDSSYVLVWYKNSLTWHTCEETASALNRDEKPTFNASWRKEGSWMPVISRSWFNSIWQLCFWKTKSDIVRKQTWVPLGQKSPRLAIVVLKQWKGPCSRLLIVRHALKCRICILS